MPHCCCAQDTAVKLAWIREAAPNLDPEDALLAPHMRQILALLFRALQAVQASAGDPADKKNARVVAHIVNSQLHQCQ